MQSFWDNQSVYRRIPRVLYRGFNFQSLIWSLIIHPAVRSHKWDGFGLFGAINVTNTFICEARLFSWLRRVGLRVSVVSWLCRTHFEGEVWCGVVAPSLPYWWVHLWELYSGAALLPLPCWVRERTKAPERNAFITGEEGAKKNRLVWQCVPIQKQRSYCLSSW